MINTELIRSLPVKQRWILSGLLATASLVGLAQLSAARVVQVRVNRFLEVRNPIGQVYFQQGTQSRRLKAGDRLAKVGDGVRTGPLSGTLLALDTGIGFARVSEKTQVQVQTLRVLPNGGRITQLAVPRGQVRLQVRRFTNPNSRLEILTPAGVSGVRGTTFGVAVQPNGTTGVATLEGRVEASAQGRAVSIPAGFQSQIRPGQPPSDPVPFFDDASLDLKRLVPVAPDTFEIAGQVNPGNLVEVMDTPQNLDDLGQFRLRLPIPSDRRVAVAITTPLGTQNIYVLAIP